MTIVITERQKLILDTIRSYMQETGYSPSVRDLADLCGIRSTQGVVRHLKALEDKGFIQRDSKARSIRILAPAGAEAVSEGALPLRRRSPLPIQIPEPEPLSAVEMVPLVGQVAAGIPIAAVENIEERIPVSRALLTHGPGSFLLRVKGDSMKEGIQPHDLILVTPGLEARRGEIVVALIDDEATVKRFYPEADRVILRADNPAYSDIVVSRDLRLVGKVTGLIRQY